MNRRRSIMALGLLGLWPALARSQGAKRKYRIGYLLEQSLTEPPTPERAAFLRGLSELGYAERANLEIMYRSAESEPTFLPDLAAELVGMPVDVIVALTVAAASAAMKTTRTIPIVFISGVDPVLAGLAKSLARPGGNVTGITLLMPALEPKRLQLLRDMLPRAKRVAVLSSSAAAATRLERHQLPSAAAQLGLALEPREIRDGDELVPALEKIAASKPDALLVLPTARLIGARREIAAFALQRGLPSMMGFGDYAEHGGLAAYAPSTTEQFHRLASYVDRILKGAKAADLPIEQPAKFELALNLKTARTLGITIPQLVLLRADRLIE
jgi:putative ABC transport system substrate-binding protein